MGYNRISEILGIRYPLIQAAMNWVTNADLVAAVSNAGGMGVLGPNAGQKFEGEKRLSSQERHRREFRKIKSLTDKPFAMNLILLGDGEETYSQKVIDVALEEGVQNFVTVGPVSREIFNRIKKQNGTILHRELNPTPGQAKRAEEEGADIIIATGYDEAGTLPECRTGTFSIVPAIADAVDVPVLAAGGINDIRGVRAAFALGAEGVYVGTRFIVTEECPAPKCVKEDIIRSKAEDLIFVSPTTRSIPHKYAREMAEMYEKGASHEKLAKIIEHIDSPSMRDGKLDEGIVSVNTAIDLIHEIKSCASIVKELMADGTFE